MVTEREYAIGDRVLVRFDEFQHQHAGTIVRFHPTDPNLYVVRYDEPWGWRGQHIEQAMEPAEFISRLDGQS